MITPIILDIILSAIPSEAGINNTTVVNELNEL